MRTLTLCAVVVGSVVLAVLGGVATASEGESPRHDVLYTCGCGPDCGCKTVSLEPGACACGKELVWGHVVKIDGTDALVCRCEKGCSCKIKEDDPTKCACGQDLHRVSLKGTGIYFCNCGGSCTCNHLSATTGTCGCGMTLKKAD